MSLGLRIESLTFSGSDQPVATRDAELVVLIGPNNTGKTRALRDIQQFMVAKPPGQVVTGVGVIREGSEEDMRAWLSAATIVRMDEASAQENVISRQGTMSLRGLLEQWIHGDSLQALGYILVRLVDAETRLQLAQSVPSV